MWQSTSVAKRLGVIVRRHFVETIGVNVETGPPGIRLLACDMDGTLFRQDLVISERVQLAIGRAQQAGVIVALATGRMPAAARSFVKLLGLSGPQIFSNGALVQTPDGEVVLHV